MIVYLIEMRIAVNVYVQKTCNVFSIQYNTVHQRCCLSTLLFSYLHD